MDFSKSISNAFVPTNHFLQQFRNKNSQLQDDQRMELNQMANCINLIKNGGEEMDIYNSIRHVIQHLQFLDSEDSIAIGPSVLNYALEFNCIELAAISMHLLGILVNNSIQKDTFKPIFEEFINKSILQIDYITELSLGPLSYPIEDFIFCFISISKETFDFSINNGLIDTIIKRPFPNQTDNFDQMQIYLHLIFSITKKIEIESQEKEYESQKPKFESLLIEVYKKVSMAMNFQIPQLYDICLLIYSIIFDFEVKNTLSIHCRQLFENFFQTYSTTLYDNCKNLYNFLKILLMLSKTSFSHELLVKYDIFKLIYPYILVDINDMEKLYNKNEIEISWKIAANFISKKPDQVKNAILNHIAARAIEICEIGTIEMKCFVISFLSNILLCSYDEEAFKFCNDNDVLEKLLLLVECVPEKYSSNIVKSICNLIDTPAIPQKIKLTLFYPVRTDEIHDTLTEFVENTSIEESKNKGLNIMYFLDEQMNSSDDLNEEEEEFIDSNV